MRYFAVDVGSWDTQSQVHFAINVCKNTGEETERFAATGCND